MVVPGNDSLELFLTAIQVVKNPLESNFLKVANNFKNCFNGVAEIENLSDYSNVKQVAVQLNVKKKSGQNVREKGKFPIKVFLGIYTEKCGNNGHDKCDFSCDWVERVKISMSKKGLKESPFSSKGNSCYGVEINLKESTTRAGKKGLPFECLKRFIFGKLRIGYEAASGDHLKALFRVLGDRRELFDGFLTNLKFARVGGVPSSIVEEEVIVNEENSGENLQQKFMNGMLSVPSANVERLRSTLSNVSLTELVELLPQIGRPLKEDHPEKTKLFSVQDFFRYTDAEGRRSFQELDRDGDGQVTLKDLEIAMSKRKLPKRYAYEFMCRAKGHWFSKSFDWKQFSSLIKEKEPTILRSYLSLCLSNSRTFQKSDIFASLENAGHLANEDNAVAIMRYLNAYTKESMTYGHFRKFMLLLPSDQLHDSRIISSEADSVLKSALAGGLSCALSASIMHPVDTVKTWVQASPLTFPEVMSKLPQFGVRSLYRGSIPAILGQFSSHGLRTGICEASKLVLVNVAPTLSETQVESVASFCGTFFGTAMRIPCEVLKQRLQAGLFENVGEAIVGTWRQDGLGGFFRGTGATLCREIPFYVAGMGLYAESKKAVQRLIGRELQPWETVAVGALSGGLTAVLTTPIDVIKTRMMIATQGQYVTLSIIVLSILSKEGPLGLYKGAIPRFFWVAPLGAMNFAGYELLRKAMN